MCRKVVLAIFVGVMISGISFAEEKEKKASFTISQGMLHYKAANDSAKVDGETTKVKTTEVATFSTPMELSATIDKVVIYLYPTQPASAFGLGYYVMTNLETGVFLGLNSKDVNNPKNKTQATDVSLYGIYYLELKGCSLELRGSLGMSKSTSEQTFINGTVESTSKTNESGTSIDIGVDHVLPLTDNFAYVAGIGYSMSNSEEKETKTKLSSSTLTLNLATVRVIF